MIIHNIHESLDMFFEFEFDVNYIIPEIIEVSVFDEICFKYRDPQLSKTIKAHTKKKEDISFVVPLNPQRNDIRAIIPSIPYALEVKTSENEDRELREYIRKNIF